VKSSFDARSDRESIKAATLKTLRLHRSVTEAEVLAMVERHRNKPLSPKKREKQLVNFVWGNAPEGDQGTKDTVRKHLRLRSN
jgi:DNA-binding response OmpR family regulator